MNTQKEGLEFYAINDRSVSLLQQQGDQYMSVQLSHIHWFMILLMLLIVIILQLQLQGIGHEPAFNYRVHHMLKKRDKIIASIRKWQT